jgi:hypothetical protein
MISKIEISQLSRKKYLMLFGALLLAIVLVSAVSFSLATAPTIQTQTPNIAGSETQFRLNVAYAYVGKGIVNDTVTDFGNLIVAKTQYPSSIEFNVTRILGVQIKNCDAVIEVYVVEITTNTGMMEKNAYFIGTNYAPCFSNTQVATLFNKVNDFVSPQNLTNPIRGNFEFNMTDNSSILSLPIGSSGVYSSFSSLGLWTKGQPDVVSVTVQRMGYLTISNDSVSVFKDPSGRDSTATAQLSRYGTGFLHNNIVTADKLASTDLFHPQP